MPTGLDWKNITKDDTIIIQSNVVWTLKTHKCTVQDILESFLEVAGTVLFPAFNVEFAEGAPFDIRTTPSRMGVLTECARNYPGAVRSGHPMYSFIAIGKNASMFNVNNFSGYGKDSPFGILHRLHGKIGVLGIPDSQGNSFHHHIEEMNRVPYRFYKNFTGDYTDRHGVTEERTYSFYCRNAGNATILDPAGELMWKEGICKGDKHFEGTGFRVIETDQMFDFVTDIIKTNRARGLLYKEGNMTEQEIFKILEETLTCKLEMDAEGQWDSLDYVVMVQKLDEVFDGRVDKLPERELSTMTTPRKVINLLKKHNILE